MFNDSPENLAAVKQAANDAGVNMEFYAYEEALSLGPIGTAAE